MSWVSRKRIFLIHRGKKGGRYQSGLMILQNCYNIINEEIGRQVISSSYNPTSCFCQFASCHHQIGDTDSNLSEMPPAVDKLQAFTMVIQQIHSKVSLSLSLVSLGKYNKRFQVNYDFAKMAQRRHIQGQLSHAKEIMQSAGCIGTKKPISHSEWEQSRER